MRDCKNLNGSYVVQTCNDQNIDMVMLYVCNLTFFVSLHDVNMLGTNVGKSLSMIMHLVAQDACILTSSQNVNQPKSSNNNDNDTCGFCTV